MIYDLILCGVLILAFIIGTSRGLLRTIWGICALTASVVLAGILHPYAMEKFENSIIAENLNTYVYTTVSEKMADTSSEEVYTLPESFGLNLNTAAAEEQLEAVTESILTPVISIACGLFLFILIRIALAIVYNILKVVFSFPVLKQTNKLAGGVVQTVIALALVYAVLAIAAVSGTDVLNDSVVCKIMYENNILLTLLATT